MTSIALIHPTGLLGDELRDTLSRRPELGEKILLLSDEAEEIGTLSEVRGSAAVVAELDESTLDGVDVAFFCGAAERSRPLFDQVPAAATAVVLSPDASPDDGDAVVAGVNLETARRGRRLLSPPPAAVFLSHLLHPLRGFGLVRAEATLLQPISVFDRAALDEVFDETRRLLRFEPRSPEGRFSTQLAFNVIPDPRPELPLAAHLGPILGCDLDLTVQVVQAGVFHGYGASLHVTLAEDPGAEALRKTLGEHPANDLAVDPELLGMIDAAAREEVLIGAVRPDGRKSGGYWIWAVMDNLTRGGALNAMQILEAVLPPVVH